MGVHPDIQERCAQELREIFGDSDRPATFQDTLEMKYLERCIMETLRMFPPVPIIARHIKQNAKLRKSTAHDENNYVGCGRGSNRRFPDCRCETLLCYEFNI